MNDTVIETPMSETLERLVQQRRLSHNLHIQNYKDYLHYTKEIIRYCKEYPEWCVDLTNDRVRYI